MFSLLPQEPVIVCFGTLQGRSNSAFSCVVGGCGQKPFAELPMQVLEIGRGSARREHGIAALVQPGVYRQPILKRGGAHELPGPQGMGSGESMSGKAAF